MVKKIYTIDTTNDMIGDLSSKLTAYYGAGITIHYSSAYYLIFTCPAISSKVIRMFRYSTGYFQITYGTTYVSDSTITDPRIFHGYDSNSFINCRLVLCPDAIILTGYIPGPNNVMAYIGKLSNSKTLLMGLSQGIYDTYSNLYKLFIAETNTEMKPITFSQGFHLSNKLFTQPILISNLGTGALELNVDNSPATVNNILNISAHTISGFIYGNGYILTPSTFTFGYNTLKVMTSLYIPYDEVVS